MTNDLTFITPVSTCPTDAPGSSLVDPMLLSQAVPDNAACIVKVLAKQCAKCLYATSTGRRFVSNGTTDNSSIGPSYGHSTA
jgi:hypothetical protein